jgi:ATP-binding cassette subfamily F protein 2
VVQTSSAVESTKNPSKRSSIKKEKPQDGEEKKDDLMLSAGSMDLEQLKREAALDKLLRDDIVVTYEAKKGQMHANTRDIFVSGVTVTFHGKPLIEDTDIQINYGNRYGFLGPNGSGKSTVRILF